MHLDFLLIYVICINIAAFIVCMIDNLVQKRQSSRNQISNHGRSGYNRNGKQNQGRQNNNYRSYQDSFVYDDLKSSSLCNIMTIFGGALGTTISEFIWGGKWRKKNVAARMYSIVWLVIQTMIFLAIYGPNRQEAAEWFKSFTSSHILLCVYILLVNIVTFVVFTFDKVSPLIRRSRIPEAVLMGLSLAGGAAGGLFAMGICNHKMKKPHFIMGISFILIAHFAFLLCLVIGII